MHWVPFPGLSQAGGAILSPPCSCSPSPDPRVPTRALHRGMGAGGDLESLAAKEGGVREEGDQLPVKTGQGARGVWTGAAPGRRWTGWAEQDASPCASGPLSRAAAPHPGLGPSLRQRRLTQDVQDGGSEAPLQARQTPPVRPRLGVLGLFNHQPCLAPLNPELPPIPAEASWGLLVEDQLPALPGVGSQGDAHVGEGVGHAAGQLGVLAPGHRHHARRAVGAVPACGGMSHTLGRAGRQDAHRPPSPGAWAPPGLTRGWLPPLPGPCGIPPAEQRVPPLGALPEAAKGRTAHSSLATRRRDTEACMAGGRGRPRGPWSSAVLRMLLEEGRPRGHGCPGLLQKLPQKLPSSSWATVSRPFSGLHHVARGHWQTEDTGSEAREMPPLTPQASSSILYKMCQTAGLCVPQGYSWRRPASAPSPLPLPHARLGTWGLALSDRKSPVELVSYLENGTFTSSEISSHLQLPLKAKDELH